MTTINATINGESAYGNAAKRIDIWHEGGGIGRWELQLLNDSGASQILTPYLEATVLGINGTTLMTGRVDDVLPDNSNPQAVTDKLVTVHGRNFGRDLARLFHIHTYAGEHFDDVVEDALTELVSEITYTSPGTAPVVDINFNKTYLQNGFVEAAQRIDYDFVVKNDKAFDCWALASAPSSGVLLKSVAEASDNNILLIHDGKIGVDIYNLIRVDAGNLDDHWTEGNSTDWIGTDCTVSDSYDVYVAGAASIMATVNISIPPGPLMAYMYLGFPKYNYAYLDLSNVLETACSIWLSKDSTLLGVQIYARDDEGNEILNVKSIGSDASGILRKVDFKMGSSTTSEWTYLTGSSFTWKIVRIGVYITISGGGVTNKHVWVDGLRIDGIDVWAYAMDEDSIGDYGAGMLPLNRTDIKSQLQLQEVADAELARRKDPCYKLKLTCTLQTSLLYAGYLVNVLAPADYIGSGVTPVTYRILSIHHAAEPGTDLCRGHDAITELELVRHDGGAGADPTRFKLASAPQAAINIRYDNRLRVLEGSLTGSGSVIGSSGGGGGAWNGGVVTNPVELSCEAPSLSNFQMIAQIYAWLGEDWQPNLNPRTDDVDQFSSGTSFIRLKDNTSNNYLDIFLITSLENSDNPLLCVNHGMIVKKDFQAGGFIGADQGALLLGHGLTVADDPPKISLTHSDSWISGVDSGTSFPGSPDELDYFIRTDYTPDRLYQYVNGEWESLGSVENYNGGYETLYITRGNAVKSYGTDYTPAQLAHIRCGEVHAYGGLVQFEATADGATRIAQVDDDVISIQSYTGAAWVLANLNVSTLFVDHINSASAGGIYLFDHVRFYTGSAGVKLYDATNDSGSEGEILTVNGSGLPVWASPAGGSCNWTADAVSAVDSPLSVASGHLKISATPTFSGVTIGTIGLSENEDDALEIDGDVVIDLALGVGNGLGVTGTIGATGQIGTTVATGTAPFAVSSTTVCNNLNADLFDGHHWADVPSAQWTAGAVASVSAPLSISGTALIIGQSTTSTNGYLSSTDWNTFNGKYGSGSSPTFNEVTGESFVGTYGASNNIFYVKSSMLAVDWANWMGWSDAHFGRADSAVISVLDDDGELATLNTSNLFADHINSASAGGIYIMDKFMPYSATIDIGSSTGYFRTLYIDNISMGQTIVFTGAKIYNSTGSVLQIQDLSGNLSTLDVSNLFADHINSASSAGITIMDHLKMYSPLNILPDQNGSGNLGGDGTGTSYYWASVWASYIRYKNTPSSFDHLDDLELVKNYKVKSESKTHPTTRQVFTESVVDMAGLPFLVDDGGFFDPARLDGFLLGCAKRIALKQDENEERFAALLEELDTLKEDISKLKSKSEVNAA